ncbi:hypothetical protein [Natronobiforma cellulositropha]|uniref:hypothetical protein n=1 Tax=Natronobiforma cellulositropha TaxID=1679076 RepID=UPI0021D57AC1|nr:hypothetical protein [Natronobiforma cellulositropha]
MSLSFRRTLADELGRIGLVGAGVVFVAFVLTDGLEWRTGAVAVVILLVLAGLRAGCEALGLSSAVPGLVVGAVAGVVMTYAALTAVSVLAGVLALVGWLLAFDSLRRL